MALSFFLPVTAPDVDRRRLKTKKSYSWPTSFLFRRVHFFAAAPLVSAAPRPRPLCRSSSGSRVGVRRQCAAAV
ncbi:hypothetical protein COT52_02415 [candidate division WWE3 bacterium CG08_land_8_20_14_0_20_43_13]|uniref:Uncharacterized protein n=1 Tax=candidate division WWE3 bacterium CG08_land_8_20_14_0_20_43_13 TaxID=1975087 RepID=A0A2H0X746_UNCKA|nr:MAG: hypothetical protein COT52_02415 [candidate division WWE3 bacterium CG08_land_8_20_14_0_20_43_13]